MHFPINFPGPTTWTMDEMDEMDVMDVMDVMDDMDDMDKAKGNTS